MEIIDNFVSENIWRPLKESICSDSFPWYYNEHSAYEGDGIPQLTHTIWDTKKGPMSDLYTHLLPVIQCFQMMEVSKLGRKKWIIPEPVLVRIKMNLDMKTENPIQSAFHQDLVPSVTTKNRRTAILYVNTNNGCTKFHTKESVKSVENRCVIFDSDVEHSGVTSTNDRRIVINFNYFI